MPTHRRPNIVFIFADEWRAQATGYNGDTNCRTPTLDALARQSTDITLAVSGCSVCCPYRGSLMTGQYPLTNGVFINDVELRTTSPSIAQAFAAGGYRTAYIGKWHLHGSPEGKCERRKLPVPRESQLGFHDWWGYECCHDYWNSPYFHNDNPAQQLWQGYDLFAQADHAAGYIRTHAADAEPFMLVLSWGPPHFPLKTAPDDCKKLYENAAIALRPNVPPHRRERALQDLRGYYAHIAALDRGLATVLAALDAPGIADNTLFIITSDHGEMAQSQGLDTKMFPFEESIRVPFLLRWPERLGRSPRQLPLLLDAPDIMPTLLGLCDLPMPPAVQGANLSPFILGHRPIPEHQHAFLSMPVPITELRAYGFPAYRGLRTTRHTYITTHDGPFMLFDNLRDPFQLQNLIRTPDLADLRRQLDRQLQSRLHDLHDDFLPPEAILQQAGLSHYKEANVPLREQWQFPGTTPALAPPNFTN